MNVNLTDAVAVDTHCHVDLYPEEGIILAEALARRILIVAVTNAPSVFFHTQQLAQRCPYLLPAVGLHPELVGTHEHELSKILPLLEQTRFVGEVGLDYVTPDKQLRARQRAVFTAILERCAVLGGKILTVHSRRAASDVIAAVGAGFNGKVILHWFSGTIRDAERALENGCYFSINTAMTVSKSSASLLAILPRDRILTETDGPFVKLGAASATPSHVLSVLKHLAAQWQMTESEAGAQLMANFSRLLTRPTDRLPRD